jgi:hypothetical protein
MTEMTTVKSRRKRQGRDGRSSPSRQSKKAAAKVYDKQESELFDEFLNEIIGEN